MKYLKVRVVEVKPKAYERDAEVRFFLEKDREDAEQYVAFINAPLTEGITYTDVYRCAFLSIHEIPDALVDLILEMNR